MQQIVTPRRGGQAVVGGRGRVNGIPQRPVRRDRPSAAPANRAGVRGLVGYLPWVGRLLLAVIVGLLLFAGYRAAASANFFAVKNIDVTGVSRVSPDEVRALVRRNSANTGVWNANVAAIRAEIEALPWVRSATVSRVLPDGLRVRVTERSPYAIVHTDNGKLMWVDQDAVILGPMSLQRDQLPPFFLRGWDTGWNAQDENRKRLELYEKMLATWQSLGIATRVSELDLTNPKYVLVNLNGDHSQVTVKLLTDNYGEGLQRALEKLSAAQNAAQVTSVTVLPNRTILDVPQRDDEPRSGSETQAQLNRPETEDGPASQPAEADSGAGARRVTVAKPIASRSGKPAATKKPERVKPKVETRDRRVR